MTEQLYLKELNMEDAQKDWHLPLRRQKQSYRKMKSICLSIKKILLR